MLAHMAVPQFYPNIFCFITGILETFGQLVFERIRVLAEEVDSRMGGGKPLPGGSPSCVRALPSRCVHSATLCCCLPPNMCVCVPRGLHVQRYWGRGEGNVPQLDLQDCVHSGASTAIVSS
jgi:hypothetical protein